MDRVVAVRGGYGVGRFLARFDPAVLRRSPTLIWGYSDTTSLSLWLLRHGHVSVHGPMLDRADVRECAHRRLAALLRGDEEGLAPLAGQPLAPGRARGRLVGGNLKLLAASLGTPWELDARGAILFFEELNEAPYALDRSLAQLHAAGKLEAVAGVAVGQLVNCESERYPETTSRDVVRESLLGVVDGPVVVGLPFGHIGDNHALAVGTCAELDGDAGVLRLLEPVVGTVDTVETRA